MLPDDDSIEIIDTNNNEGESLKKPDEEKDHDDSVEIVPDYEVLEEQNVKEIKILVVRESVAERIFTLDVPMLWDEYDILTTIFPMYPIYKEGLGFRMADKDNVEKLVRVVKVNEYNGSYQYRLEIKTPTLELKGFDQDCHVEEDIQIYLPPMEPTSPSVKCSSPKSVDSQETYIEGETNEDSIENDAFMSCLDDENDITVKKGDNFFSCPDNAMEIDPEKNEKNCDALFAILNQDKHEQEERITEDDREALRDSPNAKNSYEIETSKFYSPSILKRSEDSFSSPSQNTIQLSDSPIMSGRKSQRNSKSSRDSILAVYPPPPEKGGIPIYKENYKCLSDGEYLNDVIIDFYLKYLTNEVLSEQDRKRTHVFSSQFFTRLSKPPVANNDAQVVITELERRHNGVERWTKNVNIFEKDFVIIPINEHFHWNLAIICYPGLVGMMDNAVESSVRPCILFFDSLLKKSKDRIATILRGYLAQEYLAKMGEEKSFSKSALKIIYPRVPKQSNATDCGLYVLQYVEQFFKNPIMDFTVPLDLSQWFKRSVIKQKRARIASLVAELAKNYNSGKVVSLPHLEFSSVTELSDEEDSQTKRENNKRKNPLYKEKYSSYFTKDSKTSSDAESCSPVVLKKKKSRQSSLREWVDSVREAPSSSYKLELSTDFKSPEHHNDMNDDLMDSKEDDVVMEEPNVSTKNGNESPDIISDIESPEKSSFLSDSLHRSYIHVRRKIGLITEDFSGSKSHIFEKSVFSDKNGEQSCSGARPKRKCRTKEKSEIMMKFTAKYREQKRKNELKLERCASGENKKPSNWIDTSDFNSSKPYSLFNVDEERGIPPSTSYSQFKAKKKFEEQLLSRL